MPDEHKPIYVYPAANGRKWHIAVTFGDHVVGEALTVCGRQIRVIGSTQERPQVDVCSACSRNYGKR
jgi:hypothetical protein